MREHISILIFLFSVSISINAQQIDTIYYDNNWNVSNSKNYKYYRLFVEIDGEVKVTDYYRNGNIQMTGGYKSVDFKEPTGPFFYYDKKSKLTSLELYEPHLYPQIRAKLNKSEVKIPEIEDLSAILYVTYYKNETIRTIGYGFDKCTAHGTWLYFTKKGNLMFKYNYFLNEEDGECVWYWDNGKKWIIGNYKNGLKEGPWKHYNADGTLTKTVIFIEGKKLEKIR
jgi:antitoxin component YwqK of YwqJK toxin-antitoxin module